MVTGSAGHLGEALMLTLRSAGRDVLGIDRRAFHLTDAVGDVVSAHRLALERAPAIGFGRYVISATTPFTPADLGDLRSDAPRVVGRLCPGYEDTYARLGWRMFPGIDRVYVNARARQDLGWQPRYDFGTVCSPRGRTRWTRRAPRR